MEKAIFIVENLTDVKVLKNKINNFSNPKIFTLNYTAHRLLEKNHISHEIGDLYLSNSDKETINRLALETTLNWWKNQEIQNLITTHEIILSELIEMELFQYFLAIFKSAKIILKIIQDIIPDTIIGITNLNHFLESICKTKNIKFESLPSDESLSLHYDKINIKYNVGPIPLSITTSRQNYKKIKNLTEKISQKSFRLNPEKKYSQDDAVLLLDFNPTSYEILIKELAKLGKNIFLLNQRRPAIWNKKSLGIVKKSNCKVIDLSNFEKKIKSKITNEQKLLFTNLEKIWKNDSLFEKLLSIDSYTLWSSIKPIFIKICHERFSESLRRILLLHELFNQFKISLILEWAETGQEEKEVLAVSKKFGIKSIMLQHSMFPIAKIWKPFGRFLGLFSHEHQSDKQAVWGNLTMDYAISNGLDKDKLLLTGSPKHDAFFSLEKNEESTGKILLATTGPPAIFTQDSTTDVFVKYDQYIKEVFRVMKKYPDKQLIVKPHPQSDFINNTLQLINETDSNAKIILETDLPELINDCDLVISFNTSTILLESLILQKPTISLITDDWATENEIIKMNGVMAVDDIHDVESSISRIMSDEDYRRNLRKNASLFLESYLSNHGIASKKLVDILNKI